MFKLLRIACLVAMAAAPAYAQGQAQRPAPAASVQVRPPALTASPQAPTSIAPILGKVDINGATAAQLDTLPGIGPARAQAIIAGRPYTDPAELVSKKVLSQSVFDGAKSRVALANINSSTAADLGKALPGIGEVRAKAIVAGRPYGSPPDLVTKGVLTQSAFDKIKDLVAF